MMLLHITLRYVTLRYVTIRYTDKRNYLVLRPDVVHYVCDAGIEPESIPRYRVCSKVQSKGIDTCIVLT